MSPFPLETWADKNPSVRWPVVYAVLTVLVLVGSSVAGV